LEGPSKDRIFPVPESWKKHQVLDVGLPGLLGFCPNKKGDRQIGNFGRKMGRFWPDDLGVRKWSGYFGIPKVPIPDIFR